MSTDFGKVVDYFALATEQNGLRLKSSLEGCARTVTETAQLCVINARDSGMVCKNPSCVYAITKQGTITIALGKVYGNGFMIHTVVLRTQSGQPPTLTVVGVENEGEDAIQQYAISITVLPRSKAQDPLAALVVPSDASLIECVTTWTAVPVLVVDCNEIVASDIQHGIVNVEARIIATADNVLPTVASGWDIRNDPSQSGTDNNYLSFDIVATKTL